MARDFKAAAAGDDLKIPTETKRLSNSYCPPPQMSQEQFEKSRDIAHQVAESANSIGKGTDYRAWARRILANPKRYPEISVRLAREAIGQQEYYEPGSEG